MSTIIETSASTPSFLDRNLIRDVTNDYQKGVVAKVNEAGYTVATRGTHSGSLNSYGVYIYKTSDVKSLRQNNSRSRAVCIFSVRYRYKRFAWARAQRVDMNDGLRSFANQAGICI